MVGETVVSRDVIKAVVLVDVKAVLMVVGKVYLRVGLKVA